VLTGFDLAPGCHDLVGIQQCLIVGPVVAVIKPEMYRLIVFVEPGYLVVKPGFIIIPNDITKMSSLQGRGGHELLGLFLPAKLGNF
jgi:hypothetical protein